MGRSPLCVALKAQDPVLDVCTSSHGVEPTARHAEWASDSGTGGAHPPRNASPDSATCATKGSGHVFRETRSEELGRRDRLRRWWYRRDRWWRRWWSGRRIRKSSGRPWRRWWYRRWPRAESCWRERNLRPRRRSQGWRRSQPPHQAAQHVPEVHVAVDKESAVRRQEYVLEALLQLCEVDQAPLVARTRPEEALEVVEQLVQLPRRHEAVEVRVPAAEQRHERLDPVRIVHQRPVKLLPDRLHARARHGQSPRKRRRQKPNQRRRRLPKTTPASETGRRQKPNHLPRRRLLPRDPFDRRAWLCETAPRSAPRSAPCLSIGAGSSLSSSRAPKSDCGHLLFGRESCFSSYI